MEKEKVKKPNGLELFRQKQAAEKAERLALEEKKKLEEAGLVNEAPQPSKEIKEQPIVKHDEAVKKKQGMELTIDPTKTYRFELIKKSTANRNVVIGSTNKIFDVEANRIRDIKYIPTAPSIFVDEVDASFLELDAPFLAFHHNELSVEGTDIRLLEYLMRHDDNEDNPKRLNQREPTFRIVDKSVLEKKKSADYDTIDDVRKAIAEKDADELRPLARILYGIVEEDDLSLRNRLRDLFNDNDLSKSAKKAQDVLDNLTNPKFERQYSILKGFEQGVLLLKRDQQCVVWASSGTPVCDVRNTKNQDKTAGELAEWTFTSDDGKKFWEVFSKKV